MKYLVLSSETADKPDSFVQPHSIHDTLDAANDAAKTLLCQVTGNFSVDYDEDGCLVMGPEEPTTVNRGRTKKPSFKVSVVALDYAKLAPPPAPSREPTTEEVSLYRLTLTQIRRDREGMVTNESVKKDIFFASKIKALEYFYLESINLGSGHSDDDDATNDFVDVYIRKEGLPAFATNSSPLVSLCLALDKSTVKVIFRSDQLKKGWVETPKEMFRAKDWDGTKRKYEWAKERDEDRVSEVESREEYERERAAMMNETALT